MHYILAIKLNRLLSLFRKNSAYYGRFCLKKHSLRVKN